VVDVVPLVMRAIRREMRAAASPALTVPQLRTLIFVKRNPDVNLSALAEHLGIGLTGASGLVDRMVKQRLLVRETDPNERRRIQLTVTPAGHARLDAAVYSTRAAMAQHLDSLDPDEAAIVESAMAILRAQFGALR
jgi:DNA-binding MarR family transcriptional regulator